jgi:hypothetical protein
MKQPSLVEKTEKTSILSRKTFGRIDFWCTFFAAITYFNCKIRYLVFGKRLIWCTCQRQLHKLVIIRKNLKINFLKLDLFSLKMYQNLLIFQNIML